MEIVKKNLRQFIVDNFLFGEDGDGLKDEDSLLEKGLIDSTGILELVAYLQKRFHIRVEDNEIVPENLDSLQKIAGYIKRKSADGTKAAIGGNGIPQEDRNLT